MACRCLQASATVVTPQMLCNCKVSPRRSSQITRSPTELPPMCHHRGSDAIVSGPFLSKGLSQCSCTCASTSKMYSMPCWLVCMRICNSNNGSGRKFFLKSHESQCEKSHVSREPCKVTLVCPVLAANHLLRERAVPHPMAARNGAAPRGFSCFFRTKHGKS